jgi:hypothetical protein
MSDYETRRARPNLGAVVWLLLVCACGHDDCSCIGTPSGPVSNDKVLSELSGEERLSFCEFVKGQIRPTWRTCEGERLRTFVPAECVSATKISQCAWMSVGQINSWLAGTACDLYEVKDTLGCVGVKWSAVGDAGISSKDSG